MLEHFMTIEPNPAGPPYDLIHKILGVGSPVLAVLRIAKNVQNSKNPKTGQVPLGFWLD